MYAVNKDIIDMLARAGTNINAFNSLGYTALIHAIRNHRIEAINALIALGC